MVSKEKPILYEYYCHQDENHVDGTAVLDEFFIINDCYQKQSV